MESEHLELERALAGETANTGMDMITTDTEVWSSVCNLSLLTPRPFIVTHTYTTELLPCSPSAGLGI